jgi:hypothetical protein
MSSVEVYASAVKALNLSQPDALSCQSACVAMAIGNPNVAAIRAELVKMPGGAGSPANMGRILRAKHGSRYIFDDNASLSEAREWIRGGEFLITHGWFTTSGHVICLDGLELDTRSLSYRFSVKDPWSEFDAPSWSYRSSSRFFDGYYSSRCIFASCVKGASRDHALSIYRRGELDSSLKGAWIHRILPAPATA